MGEFAATPFLPVAGAGSETLLLCPMTIVGVDPVGVHRRPTIVVVVVVVVIFAAFLCFVIL